MQVITKPISELKRAERNVRLHGDRQIKEYIRSIEMFGQVRPLVIDENNTVLCGNGLLQALQQMGAETADCYVVEGLSANKKKKLMLADNKIYELGVNNTTEFDNILKELAGDIDVPGYDEELLKVLTAGAKEADEYIDSYGKFSPERVEQMKQTTTVQYSVPPQQPPPPQANTERETPQPSEPANTESQPIRKFVTCPRCGEKIWL